MNRLIISFLVGCSLMSCSHLSNSNLDDRNSRVYKNERIEKLANGLTVYFVEDQSLPRLSLQLLIPVGIVNEPQTLGGLNAATAYLLDQGTEKKKALEIADLFADSGADFEAQGGADFTLLSTSSLVTEFKNVLGLFTEVLMTPTFPPAEIERARQMALVGLKGRKDRSGPWADFLMQKSFYQNHPYGRDPLGTEESVKKINRQDVLNYYQKFYRPNESRLAVTGRLTPEIESEIKKQFSLWKPSPHLENEKLTFNPPLKGSISKLPSPHKAQTEIRFIQAGISRSNPDFLKLRLINEILGGGFASRLNQRVRDDLGLTYSIYSVLDTKKETGSWIISTFSKNPTAQQTVDEVFSVLKKLIDQGVSEDELHAAKNLVKAQLPRAVETADRLAYNLVALDFYGVGVDYLIHFNDRIDSYTLSEINKALRDNLKPDQMQVVVYGQELTP